ncbi:MAG: lysophospholipase [Myxococcaceae bacterium]|nr:lysophospholipase [Myxococcaceae bacterium]
MRSALLLLSLLVSGCAMLLPAPKPMRSLSWPALSGAPRCRLVLLPGMGDSAETFAEQAFVETIRTRFPRVEVLSANATLGYYVRGTLSERLEEDVVSPARERARVPLWLLGISMGGMGALMHAYEDEHEVQGLILLAPYLGEKDAVEEIRRAGGLAAWRAPPRAPLDEENYTRQIWRWLQERTGNAQQGPILLLGYGDADRLAPTDQLLADALPAGSVRTVPGGHDWLPWKALLTHFLEHPAFRSHCGDGAPD